MQIDSPTIEKYVLRALYSSLMPVAWSLSNEDIHPAVIDARVPCGSVNPKNVLQYTTKAIADSTWSCVNNKLYYLLSVSFNSL